MILLINPEHRGQVERHFRALRMALKYYGLWYGAYPYAQVTLVDPPSAPAAAAWNTRPYSPPAPRSCPARRPTTRDGDHPRIRPRLLVRAAANNEFEEAWLDEGINTYSTGKVLAKAYGAGSFPLTLVGIPLTRYSGSFKYADLETDRAAAIQAVTLDPMVTASWKFYDPMSYALNVYMRAVDLPEHPGEPHRQGGHAAGHARLPYPLPLPPPASRDFIATANEVSGRDLDWFFDEMFFGTAEWDYAVDRVTSQEITTARGMFDRQGQDGARSRPGGPRPGQERTKNPATGPGSGSGASARRGPAPGSCSRS